VRDRAAPHRADPTHAIDEASPIVLSHLEDPMSLSPDLLSILVCPACKGDLVYDAGARTLTCNACRLRYRIVDDIPVMIVEEAEKF
jgi:hypothetical protein